MDNSFVGFAEGNEGVKLKEPESTGKLPSSIIWKFNFFILLTFSCLIYTHKYNSNM